MAKCRNGSVKTELRVFVVLEYKKNHSLVAVQNAFLESFPDRNPPAQTTIIQNVRKYSNHGKSLKGHMKAHIQLCFLRKITMYEHISQ